MHVLGAIPDNEKFPCRACWRPLCRRGPEDPFLLLEGLKCHAKREAYWMRDDNREAYLKTRADHYQASTVKADRDAAAKAKAELDAVVAKAIAERDTATLAKLAKKQADAQGVITYVPTRDRYLEKGPDPATKKVNYIPLTKVQLVAKIDARVAAKSTTAAKGAEWFGRMIDDAHAWVEVNHNCRPYKEKPATKKKKEKKPTGIPKPRGRAPLGTTWDYDKGEWVGGSGGLIAGGKRLGSQKGQAAAKKDRKA